LVPELDDPVVRGAQPDPPAIVDAAELLRVDGRGLVDLLERERRGADGGPVDPRLASAPQVAGPVEEDAADDVRLALGADAVGLEHATRPLGVPFGRVEQPRDAAALRRYPDPPLRILRDGIDEERRQSLARPVVPELGPVEAREPFPGREPEGAWRPGRWSSRGCSGDLSTS
jgi:hypothetical protein